MKLICKYADLMAKLADVALVVEDSMSSDDMKNVIFKLYKSGRLELVGINQIITYRTDMDAESFRTEDVKDDLFNEEDAYYFQIKSKELMAYLSTFKSVRRTEVNSTVFEIVNNKIVLTVIETGKDDGKKLYSKWSFENVPIKPTFFSAINIEMPEQRQSENIEQIALYTSCLLPVMQNGTNLYSKMLFDTDYVVAFNPAFTTFMKNKLGDSFKGITLSYRAISFLKNIICAAESVTLAKTDQFLCFKTAEVEAFIRYDNRTPDISIYLKMMKKDHAIALDRPYFKDVLKRLSLVKDTVEIVIPDGAAEISVSNTKFNQDVPIIKNKGMAELGEVKFKILPEVLNKAIIGDDNSFSATLYLYLAPTAHNGYVLMFGDDGDVWDSVTSIR